MRARGVERSGGDRLLVQERVLGVEVQTDQVLLLRAPQVPYVAEGLRGSGDDRWRRGGEKVSLRIAVDRFGNAGIKAVLVNGEVRYLETLF